jgi:hypothetical protein
MLLAVYSTEDVSVLPDSGNHLLAATSSSSNQLPIPRKVSWVHYSFQLHVAVIHRCVWLIPATICCSFQLQQPAPTIS